MLGGCSFKQTVVNYAGDAISGGGGVWSSDEDPQLIKEALPNGGKIMIFIGRLEQDNSKRRRQGVIDELLGRPHDPTNYDPPGKVLQGR